MDYELAVRNGIFEVVTRGDAEVLKFKEILDATFGHERWKPGMPYLFDHSDLDSGPLTVNDVRRIADFCADRKKEFGYSRLAVVLRRDVEFGLARMWGVFVDGRWDAIVSIFRSRDKAVQWLLDVEDLGASDQGHR